MGRLPTIPTFSNNTDAYDPKELQVANKFSLFWLTVYRPELTAYNGPKNIKHLDYTWDAFVQWCSQTEKSSSVIDRLRFHSIHRTIYSMTSTNLQRDIVNAYRREFSDTVGAKFSKLHSSSKDKSSEMMELVNDMLDVELEYTLSPQVIKNSLLDTKYCDLQQKAMDEVYGETQHLNCDMDNLEQQSNELHLNSLLSNFDEDLSLDMFRNLQTQSTDTISKSKKNSGTPVSKKHFLNIKDFLLTKHLSTDQMHALVDTGIINIFETQSSSDFQVMHLLTGQPGTGKSYVIETILEMAHLFSNHHVATTAPYGVAAVNIYGSTMHSLFNLPFAYNSNRQDTPLTPLSKDEIITLANKLHNDKLKLLIVDEIGTADPYKIGVLDHRLRKLYDTNLPFGGINILFCGDLWQLPSMSGCLAQNMMNYQEFQSLQMTHSKDLNHKQRKKLVSWTNGMFKISSLWRRGCELLSLFKRFHLKTQQQATDIQHLQFLTDMTDYHSGIDLTRFMKYYKPLTKHDISHNPQKWMFAPYIVASNREQIMITHTQAIRFAKVHKTHVIRWRNRTTKWNAKPKDQDMLTLAQEDPAFYQYFVPSAPAFCTNNINTDLLLANGTNIKLHSLTPSSTHQRLQLESITTMPFGSVITLDQPPLAINVVLDNKFTSSEIMKSKLTMVSTAINSCSIGTDSDGNHIIPIFPGSSPSNPMDYAKSLIISPKHITIPAKHGLYGPSSATITQIFPIDLAFAMTVHKAQGQTLSSVILCLSSRLNHLHQMTRNAIYVALSRVKDKSDIRILHHGAFENPCNISYIFNQSLSTHIQSYIGYQNTSSWSI